MMIATTAIPAINSYAALKERINYLDTLKDTQEEVLKNDIKNLYESLQPLQLIKNGIAKLNSDRELKAEAAQLGLDLGLDFLIGKIFNKNSSVGAYVKTTILEQVITALRAKYGDKIEAITSGLLDRIVSFIQKK